MHKSTILLAIFIMTSLYSCVSYKAKYNHEWNRTTIDSTPYYTVYLIGDAGNAPLGKSTPVLDHLKEQLDNESAQSAIVWLGDNIYPVGLAPPSSPYFEQGKHRLMAELNTMKNYAGHKFFIPGNHDWYTYGRIGLRRQELLVDSILAQTPNPNNQKNFFIPDKGCGDPMVYELTEELGILLMDSHWYLNEKVRQGDLSVCKVKSPSEFLNKLDTLISQHRDKSLITSAHHPPYTYSRHGGKYSFKDHMFPLTQRYKNLYLPMPGAGFLFNKLRTRITDQDVYHPTYVRYRNRLISALQKKGSSIVAAGHEHTLQLIENQDQHFIVSGAGSKKNKVRLGDGSQFAIGEKGYVKLIFLNAKKALAQFIVPGLFTEYDNIAYEKIILLD